MLRAWKGTTTSRDDPVLNSRFCGTQLEVGKRYIFYTRMWRDRERTIGMCSRVVPSDQAAEDLAELGTPKEVRAADQAPPPEPPPASSMRDSLYPRRKRLPPAQSSGCALTPRQDAPRWYLILALAGAALLARRRG